jgi:hypothetical protein
VPRDTCASWGTVEELPLAFQRSCQAAGAFARVGWLQQFLDHDALHRAGAAGVPGVVDLLAKGVLAVGRAGAA